MTIEDNRIDQSKAPVEAVFVRSSEWEKSSAEAAEWLWNYAEKNFPDKSVYAFMSNMSAAENTATNRYKCISKRTQVKNWLNSGSTVVDEGYLASELGLYCWAIIEPDRYSLFKIVDYLREDRGGILFLSSSPQYAGALSEIVSLRADGNRLSIDQASTVEILKQQGYTPIRIWGNFDDRELTVEIYSQPAGILM